MVYCKSYLADGISIVKKNEKGIMWVKFDKTFFEMQCDMFTVSAIFRQKIQDCIRMVTV